MSIPTVSNELLILTLTEGFESLVDSTTEYKYSVSKLYLLLLLYYITHVHARDPLYENSILSWGNRYN